MNLLQVCTIVGDLARFENTLFFPKKKKKNDSSTH